MAGTLFVKGEKELYSPTAEPALIDVPPMPFFMIDGLGSPNEEGGAYHQAVGLLYALSYTVKMSKMGEWQPDGYFDYSVAPLEGLWQMAGGVPGVDYDHKEQFQWTAMIRQPGFVTEEVYRWALAEALRKKKVDASAVRLETYAEGRCVQCLHIGPYDAEPATVARMEAFMQAHGVIGDYEHRRHHEIYLGDPNRTAPEKLKTILRIPVVAR